jgi:hypothetical protein
MSHTPIASIPTASRRYLFARDPDRRDPPRPTNPGESISLFDLAEYVRRTVIAHADDAYETGIRGLKMAAGSLIAGIAIALVPFMMALVLQSMPSVQRSGPHSAEPVTSAPADQALPPVEAPTPSAEGHDPAADSSSRPGTDDQHMSERLVQATDAILTSMISLAKVVAVVFAVALSLIALSRTLLSLRYLRDARIGRQQMTLVPEGTAAQSPVIDAVIASMLERGEIVDATAPQRPRDLVPAR